MKYIYIVIMFCVFSMTALYAKKSELSDILQKAGEKKIIIKPDNKKQKVSKESHFIFKDSYNTNGIGMNQQEHLKNAGKSQSFEYVNKSKFKFKFNPGTGSNNIVGAQRSSSAFGASGGGQGKGRGRR